jgi:hypothetical protein
MALIQFVRNYDDLSTDKGYQFKFHCDKCGNGELSRFQPSLIGTAGSLLRAAGDIFGGVFGQAGNSAYEIQRAVGGKAHDDAIAVAVEEAKPSFTQCVRCGHWVCNEVCWNSTRGLCTSCAPKTEVEIAAPIRGPDRADPREGPRPGSDEGPEPRARDGRALPEMQGGDRGWKVLS